MIFHSTRHDRTAFSGCGALRRHSIGTLDARLRHPRNPVKRKVLTRQARRTRGLFDHLIRTLQERRRNPEAKGLGGLEIDGEVKRVEPIDGLGVRATLEDDAYAIRPGE